MTQQASLGFSKQAPFDIFRKVLRSSKNGGQEGETEHIVDETHLDGRFDQSVPIGRKANVRKLFFSELHDLWRLSRIFQDQENQAGQLKWTGFPP